MEKYKRNKGAILTYLVPGLAVYILFAVIPIFYAVILSLFDWTGIFGSEMKFVGLDNFVEMFSNREFVQALKNLPVHLIINLVVQIISGYGLALLVYGSRRKLRFIKAAFFIPVIVPLSASGIVWSRFIYFPNAEGVLNTFLTLTGFESLNHAWLINPATATAAIAFTNSWAGFGYHFVIATAALAGIDDQMLEAAKIDGVNAWQNIRYIIIPTIKGTIAISTLMITVGTVKLFDIVYVMTSGGPNGLTNVPATLLYFQSFRFNNYGLGSAIAVFIFVLSVSLAIFNLKLMNRK